MENFRQFEAGPDPFGRKWRVLFKWLQTAISLRHSDTVDVKFVLLSDDVKVEKAIAMQHLDLLNIAKETGENVTDSWCSRLAAMHLTHLIETGEDLEKDLVTVPADELLAYARRLQEEDRAEIARRRGAA